MNKKTAFLFPGQGAQYPGMGKDFYESFSSAREIFQAADDILHFSLSKCIFEGPKETLMQTKYSQPAIFVTSLALLSVIESQFPDLKPCICAGLSLGEYSALTASKKIAFEEALLLVKARGEYMQEASIDNPGTLAAVLGFPSEEIEKATRDMDQIWIANLNCPGQVVIAGSFKAIEEATTILKEKGARRVIPLDVSGAFHSGLMESAKDKLKVLLEKVPLLESDIDLIMNFSGNFVKDSDEIRSLLVRQVTSTTHWEKSMRLMDASGVETYVEIGLGRTLSGMNRKIGVKGEGLNVEKISDLEKLESWSKSGAIKR